MKYLLTLCFMFIVSISFAQVKFDGAIESGNLKSVTTTDSTNYTVTTYEDIGGRWFYFKISGVKNKFIRVNVANSDVVRAMYSYDDNEYSRFSIDESPQENVFQKTFTHDTVWVSYYTPYTLSKLNSKITEWLTNSYFTQRIIGYTDRNLPLREFTITDPFVPIDEKYVVWIHARTHPGETPSSYHFEGIVNRLLENDEFADYLRKHIEFHLVPTTNPDGVFYGRSRTNYDGIDLESNWDKPEAQTTTEVKLLKAAMSAVCSTKVINVALNLHSIASPYCTFYVHTAASTSPFFYRRQYQLAYLNTSNNDYFQQSDIFESSLRPVYPEGWLWANYGETPVALTYETPYDYYSSDIEVTNENLHELGYKTLYAISDLLELSYPKNQILDDNNATEEGDWETYDWGVQYYSNSFLAASSGNGSKVVTYTSEELPKGEYAIYAWWTADTDNASNTRFSIVNGGATSVIEKSQKIDGANWNLLTNIEVENPTQIDIKVDDNANGNVIADAFKIMYVGEISDVKDEIVANDFNLYQNYPNPFNPTTTIRFSLPKSSNVTLRIYNVLGQLVTTLVNEELTTGTHEYVFDASGYKNLASGVLYYQLQTENSVTTKGMLLVK